MNNCFVIKKEGKQNFEIVSKIEEMSKFEDLSDK